ncbi:MAG TPA: hypothetical protein PKC08_05160 [Pseudomonadales bacterium]|nr:hypothetical protein [Pseudomonadales bacterium]
MKATHLRDTPLPSLLDPFGEAWSHVSTEALALSGTPSALQPTAAVRVAFPEGTIGAIRSTELAVAHNGSEIAFHLRWADASMNTIAEENDTLFPDGAALLFPVVPGAPLMSMGAPGKPVTAWYWRADEPDRGRHVSAEGLGSTDTLDRKLVKVAGVHRDGHWHVVIARALAVANGPATVRLAPGQTTPFSLAIWEGGHRERAGIKAFAMGPHDGWHELTLDP